MIADYLFPYPDEISVAGKTFRAQDVYAGLFDQVEAARKEKIFQKARERRFGFHVLLENIYDFGNINAIQRTCESYGFVGMSLFESKKTRVSNRTSQGAHRWMEIERHLYEPPIVQEICHKIKKQGLKIVVTSLEEDSLDYRDISYDQPLALAFGNEADGVSEQLKELADYKIHIPTVGFCQSFNVSVAAAIILSHAFKDRSCSELNPEQEMILKAHYLMKALKGRKHSERKIPFWLKEKGIGPL